MSEHLRGWQMAVWNLGITVVAAAAFAWVYLSFAPGASHHRLTGLVVETRHEALVYESKHCKLYEIRIHDQYGFRTILVAEPPKPRGPLMQRPLNCKVTR